MRDLRMIILDLRGMVATGHLLRMVPLAFIAPAVSLWPYSGTMFAPALIATVVTLEPFYNNALNLWAGQVTAGVLLPVDIARTIRQRNAAVIILTWGCALFFSTVVAYVQPEPPAAADLLPFAIHLAAVQFPLLMLGNSISWQQIRTRSRWSLEDAAGVVVMAIGTALVSVPPLMLAHLPGNGIILVFYTLTMGIVWWHVAIPHTAHVIHERRADLWQQIHLT